MDVPCQDRISQLVRAGDGTLEPAQFDDLTQHIAVCPGCRSALDAQRFGHALLSQAFVVDAGIGFSTRVLANLEETDRWFNVLDFRRWTWRLGPLSAALLMAAWIVTGGITSAEQVTVTAAESAADAVLWSDVIEGDDLVSLAWQNVVDSEVLAGEGDGQ
jgi:anti-sigma factor RsiW